MRNEKLKGILSVFIAIVLFSASGCTITLNSNEATNSPTITSSAEESKTTDTTSVNNSSEEKTSSQELNNNDDGHIVPQGQGYYTGQGTTPSSYTTYYAKVEKNYLAIRSAKSYDASNELGKLYTGDKIYVIDSSTGQYWYCYAPNLGIYGYINSSYLVANKPSNSGYYTGQGTAPSNYTTYYAKVEKNYLAIRSAKSYDASNELGKLYTGDKVYVIDSSTGQYWYCYAANLGIYGYINSSYLVTSKPSNSGAYPSSSDYTVWTVNNVTNYLALRTAPAYDASNEIAKLYVGDVVYVYSSSYTNFTDTYWYVYSPTYGWGYVNSNYIFS